MVFSLYLKVTSKIMSNLKVESGLQLLSRLTKKRSLENFYPLLFTDGPHFQEVVEIVGDSGAGKSFLLCDIICQAIIPEELGGSEVAVIIFSTDGNINFQVLCRILLAKLQKQIQASDQETINIMFKESLQRLHIVDTYDAAHFSVTVQNLESFLNDQPLISMVVVDTLTAYYWSEQPSKMIKMSTYLKNTLRLIQRVTKDFKVVIFYTRQQYFDSSRSITAIENINYRIYLQRNDDIFEAIVVSKTNQQKSCFQIIDSKLIWGGLGV